MRRRKAERPARFLGAVTPMGVTILLAFGCADAFSTNGIAQSALTRRVPIIRAHHASAASSSSRQQRRRVPRLHHSSPLQAEPNDSAESDIPGKDPDGKESPCPESLDVATPLPLSSWKRLVRALPSVQRKRRDDGTKHPYKLNLGDDLDKQILGTALPSMINLAVVPVVNSVDVFWVGKLGSALALAGQAAANQAFFTLYILIAFLPNITAPLVASAVSAGDEEAAQSRVCESLFLSNLLGGIGTLLLVGMPTVGLSLVLDKGAPAMEYAAPYLRLRALSMIPALFSATGFAAYRGLLNTVTPLKVSLVTNLLNLVADPMLIFGLPALGITKGMGVAGAALATAGSELAGGLIYLKHLLRRYLVKMSRLFNAPAWKDLKPLLQGSTMLPF